MPSPALRRLIDVLVETDSIRRPALARRAGLPRQLVSDLMSGLERRSIVRVDGRFSGHPGRSELSYMLVPAAIAALALDIGDTRLAAALTDMRGTVLAEASECLPTPTPADLAHRIGRLTERLCDAAGLSRAHVRRAVAGIAIAGAETGLGARLESRLGCPVRLAAAPAMGLIAETRGGAGEGSANVVYLAPDGAALLVDGRLLRGFRGRAGAGPPGFADWGRDGPDLAGRLAGGIAVLAGIADPELVVLGGPFGARPALAEQVQAALARAMRDPVPVRPATHGIRAALLGAIRAARADLLDTVFGPSETGPAW